MNFHGVRMRIKKNYIVCLIVCIYSIIPYYFNIFGMSATNIISLILIGLFLITIDKGKLFINKCILFYMFVISCVCRSMSMAVNGSLESLYYLLKILIPFIFFMGAINTKDKFLTMIKMLVYVSGILCIFGILEELTKFNIFSLLNNSGVTLNYNDLRFGLMRIISFTGQTITYGIYTTFCMCLCFYLLNVYGKIKKNKTLLYIIYILQWINVLLTISRSSILCCILSQIILLFFCGMKKAFKIFILILLVFISVLCIGYFFVPKIQIAVSSLWYMLLAVFDSKYTAYIMNSFGNDNLNAVGHRLSLYKWVFQSMKGKWIFGNGYGAELNYQFRGITNGWHWTAIKNSIEVESLSLLFQYGIVGMIPQILLYLNMLFIGILEKRKKLDFELKLTFNKVITTIMIIYLFYFLANCMGSEEIFFYIILSLVIVYNYKLTILRERNYKRRKNDKNSRR